MTYVHELFVVDRDSYEDITNGALHRTVLGEKDKFLLSFPPMYHTDLETILKQIKDKEFIVVYEDFWDSSILRSGRFYHGDVKKSPIMILDDGSILYNQLSVNLIAYEVRKVNV